MSKTVLSHDFTAYFQYKTIDVLTNGNYKRHLTLCKERGDLWAIDMYNKQNQIHSCIKQLHNRIYSLSHTTVGIVCKNVTNCAQPPIRIFLGFSTCFITGVTPDKCLDLSKNGKKHKDVHVSPKFAYFFLFLWFVSKLEYVIRACAKSYIIDLKSQSKKWVYDCSDENMSVLREYIHEQQETCDSLFQLFNKALTYVHMSLDVYYQEFVVKPILQPHPVS